MGCLLLPTRTTTVSGGGALILHVVVHQPLTPSCHGRIRVVALGREPIEYRWLSAPEGADAQGSEVDHAPSGRYRVLAEDSTGSSAEATVDVAPDMKEAVSVVESYQVTPATTASAQDGSVTASGWGLEDGRRLTFLWTNGSRTSVPRLRDVPPGTYAIAAVSDGNVFHTLVHKASPAILEGARRPSTDPART